MKDKAKNTYIEYLLEDESFRPAYVEGSLIADAHLLLAKAFEASNLSHAELGKRLGVSRARAHEIIKGEGNLTLSLMARTAAAFDLAWRLNLEHIETGESEFTLPPFASALASKRWTKWRVVKNETPVPAHDKGNSSVRGTMVMGA